MAGKKLQIASSPVYKVKESVGKLFKKVYDKSFCALLSSEELNCLGTSVCSTT